MLQLKSCLPSAVHRNFVSSLALLCQVMLFSTQLCPAFRCVGKLRTPCNHVMYPAPVSCWLMPKHTQLHLNQTMKEAKMCAQAGVIAYAIKMSCWICSTCFLCWCLEHVLAMLGTLAADELTLSCTPGECSRYLHNKAL